MIIEKTFFIMFLVSMLIIAVFAVFLILAVIVFFKETFGSKDDEQD